MRFHFLNLNPYNKPQKYAVNFEAEVKNLSSSDNLIQLIMPFPFESSYQKLIGQFSIIPSPGVLRKESKFHNQYIYWRQNLKPNDSKTFKLEFKILVKPREESSKTADNVSAFLKSDRFVDVKRVQKLSDDLVKDIRDDYEKVRILNDYVINNLEYGNQIEGLYSSNQALTKNQVDCGGFDTLLAALCLAQKIPARLICGFFADSDNQMHAWMEIFLPNQGWIPADPSIEKLLNEGRTKKYAKLGFVGSDRIALSLGHNFKIMVGGKIMDLDIFQNPAVVSIGKVHFKSKFHAQKLI